MTDLITRPCGRVHRAQRQRGRSSSTSPTTPSTGRSSRRTISPTRFRRAEHSSEPGRCPDSRPARTTSDARARGRGRRQGPRGAGTEQGRANTLVIFTNDNGGEWLSRNAPFFHRKATLWEGGIRVPCLLRWPGRVPAGRRQGNRHHHGPDGDDPGGDERSRPGRSEARWYRPRAARPGARDAAGAHPLLARVGARAPAACRSSRPVETRIRCWRRLSFRSEHRSRRAPGPCDVAARSRRRSPPRYQSGRKRSRPRQNAGEDQRPALIRLLTRCRNSATKFCTSEMTVGRCSRSTRFIINRRFPSGAAP